uniref:Major facilitator superfamily (MFS) profile domain-containing protein n=1 Tax=Glossina brevipalpis TaxID=37001 RepID=A0A1A9WR77_9MUSC
MQRPVAARPASILLIDIDAQRGLLQLRMTVDCNPYVSVALMTISLGFNGASSVTNLQNSQDLAPNYSGTLYGIINFLVAHWAFYVAAIMILCGMILWFIFVADNPGKHKTISVEEREYIEKSLGVNVSNKTRIPPY